jgi:hypothetical protein
MTKDEALRLALEVLESASDAIESWGSYASEYFQDKHDLQGDINNTQQAITAIKAALEAKDEPVALVVYRGEICYKSTDDDQSFAILCPVNYDSKHEFADGTKFYTTPPQKEAKDEPVAWIEHHKGGDNLVWDDPSGERTPLYTTPQQRTWHGLTNEQFLEACQMAEDGNYMVAFQRIQQWLMENNA